MAGFFLTKKNDKCLNVEKTLNAFKECGMRAYTIYSIGSYDLFIFHKSVELAPYIYKCQNGLCASVGAYVYKGLNYSQSLKSTFEDFFEGRLDLSEMYGQYTLIIYAQNTINIISDPLSAKHFFSDNYFSFFSSSFFASIATVGHVSINEKAVYEKMLTGVIVSPDTLVNEIIQMNKAEQIRANNFSDEVQFIIHPDIVIPLEHKSGKKESVISQAQNIRRYFEKLKPAFEEDRVDLGLSAGHDSSLIFAAIADIYKNIHIHTHSTGHAHDREKKAVVTMAQIKGIETTIIPTPRLDEDGIELDRLLYENLYFFDGRTSHDIGGFSATYRAKYRLEATDGCKTTLTGVGGECLRNHYSIKGNIINAEWFFKDKIFNRSFVESAPKSLIESISDYHIQKAERNLKIKLRGDIKRINLRRYYSEILMADGQGNVVDAYNIVSRCFAPFLDPHIIIEAYRGINYLGNFGEYESEIICALDAKIGSCINANNGYPFDKIPLKLRIKEAIRVSVSSETWEKLNDLKKIGKNKDSVEYFWHVLKKSSILEEAFVNLCSIFPDIDFSSVIKGYAMDALVEYLALTVRIITDG